MAELTAQTHSHLRFGMRKKTEQTKGRRGITTLMLSVPDMAMGWVDPWVGLGWFGLGRVRSNMIHCKTALVNISCNHEYFLIPIILYLELYSAHHYCFSVALFFCLRDICCWQSLQNFYVVILQLWWCVTEYFFIDGLGWGNDGLDWVGLRKLDPWPCLVVLVVVRYHLSIDLSVRSRSGK